MKLSGPTPVRVYADDMPQYCLYPYVRVFSPADAAWHAHGWSSTLHAMGYGSTEESRDDGVSGDDVGDGIAIHADRRVQWIL